MRQKAFLGLILLLVVGAIVWLLLGPGGAGSRTDLARDGGGPAAPEEGAASPAGAGGPTEAGAARHHPVLFGRPRAEQVGLGGLKGRIATARDDAPVAGARLTLEGAGHGGEKVLRRIETGEDGAFAIAQVPAGEDYVLGIEAEGWPGRSRGAIAVTDGTVTDLATIWLGQKAPLAGVVLGETGGPIAGTRVSVHEGHFSYRDMARDIAGLVTKLDRDPEPVASTVTLHDGTFSFADLDPGPVTLVARVPGFAVGTLEAAVLPGGEPQKPWTVRLMRGAVVAGKVVDPSGRGLAGARVAAVAQNEMSAFLYGRAFTETAADGSFRIDTAAPGGNVMVLVAVPGYPLRMARAQAGSEDLRIVMLPTARVVFRVVLLPQETPLAGADVTVVAGTADSPNSDGSMVAARTGADGRAELTLPVGKVDMAMLTHPDHPLGLWRPDTRMRGFLESDSDGTIPPEGTTIQLGLRAGVVVRGRVLDEAGEAIAGASITPFGGVSLGRPQRSGDDGSFRVATSRASPLVVVEAHGYVTHPVQVAVPSDATEVEKDVTLARAAVVTGRVVDAHGRPVSGAQVKSVGKGGGMGVASSFLEPAPTVTGASGRYVLTSVAPADDVHVMANRAGYVAGATGALKVEPGGSARAPDIVLTEGRTLVVSVRDPDGNAVEDADVEVSFDRADGLVWDPMAEFRGGPRVRTDTVGRARLPGLPLGTAAVTASHPSWASAQKDVTIDEDSPSSVPVDLVLRPSIVVEGRVLDTDGSGLEGAWATASAGGSVVRDQTGADGHFRLEGLPEGTETVRVGKQGYRSEEVSVPPAGRPLEVRLVKLAADVQARMQDLARRMGELYQALQSAKSDAERKALQAEIGDVSQEYQRLQAATGSR